jgi:hypothetical protein
LRWAWQEVFKGAEKRKIKTATGDEVDLSVSVEEAGLRTPVISLGLSTRARNALERANVITVRDLLNFPIREIHMMRGVGNQTRQEISRCVAALKERFPNNEEPAEEIRGTPTLEHQARREDQHRQHLSLLLMSIATAHHGNQHPPVSLLGPVENELSHHNGETGASLNGGVLSRTLRRFLPGRRR